MAKLKITIGLTMPLRDFLVTHYFFTLKIQNSETRNFAFISESMSEFISSKIQ